MLENTKETATRWLRWTERYTKTDMVYLAGAGWWLNLDLVFQSLLSLILSIALANLLEPTVYGIYQYLVAISVLVAALCLSGMNNAVAQAVARGYEGVLRASVRFQLRWAVVPAVLTLAVAGYYFFHAQNEIAWGLVAVALFTPLLQTFNTYAAFLTGKKAFKDAFWLKLIANLFYYVPMFAVLPFVGDAAVLVAVNVFFTAAGNYYAYRKTLSRFSPNGAIDPETLRYGTHLSVMNGFGTVMHQLDSVLVFHFLGPVNLAVYALATLLPERIAGFSGFITSATLPKFANQPLAYIRAHLFGKLGRMAIAGILIALLYALCAPLIFRFLFPMYVSAIPYTEFYAMEIALLSISNLANVTLYAKKFTREMYALGIIQPILLVGLQLPLLLFFGIWGMLVARLISDAIGILLAIGFTFRPLQGDPQK
jgi:O-antigen/teichoic acid export membrane protein